MRLAEFIRDNEERILQEWEEFAKGLRSAPDTLSDDALRDHALGMLRSITAELKSGNGHSDERPSWVSSRGRDETAAEAHGDDRREKGFDIDDMIAEFRALRRSVVRQWGEATVRMNRNDLIGFNEAIDRELAQSVDAYTVEKDRQARLLEAMLSHASDHSCVFRPDGTILYANPAMAQAYGKHPNDITGANVDALDPAFAAEVHRQIRHVTKNGQECRGDFTAHAPDGDMRVMEYVFAPILDDEGEVIAISGNSRDVTERRAGERTLWKHANHDHLTGLPNRRLFRDRLEQDMRLAKRHDETLALLYVDLDKFKDANDHLGHEGGDELLKQAAERIAACIRETDTLARMGGDEFTVILMGARDADAVETVAQVILEQLSRPFFIQHEPVRIAGSIGIALYPQHGASVNDLTVHADRAMYAAKSAGGGEYVFFEPKGRMRPRAHADHSHPRGRPH